MAKYRGSPNDIRNYLTEAYFLLRARRGKYSIYPPKISGFRRELPGNSPAVRGSIFRILLAFRATAYPMPRGHPMGIRRGVRGPRFPAPAAQSWIKISSILCGLAALPRRRGARFWRLGGVGSRCAAEYPPNLHGRDAVAFLLGRAIRTWATFP